MVVLKAWRELQRIKRNELAMAELPVAALAALTANINRDPKKGQPFKPQDFCLFRQEEPEEAGLTAEVAAVALALRHEDKAPPILLAIWPQVLASATSSAKPPAIRALASDDGKVWVLCPAWEGTNIRGGLVAVTAGFHGTAKLRDIDRPLATYSVVVPRRALAGWLEASLLLVSACPADEPAHAAHGS